MDTRPGRWKNNNSRVAEKRLYYEYSENGRKVYRQDTRYFSKAVDKEGLTSLLCKCAERVGDCREMKIVEVKSLSIEAVKVIRFGRFCDHRGYFTEHYRKSDFEGHPQLSFMKDVKFVQTNESYSVKGTVRGLHFQWNPYVGKLVRAVSGRMVDMALDIRKGSADFGKIILYDIPVRTDNDYAEWIWLPPGFAHGVFFTEDTLIEYFCTGQYNGQCEAGISPLSSDIDWSLCDRGLKQLFDDVVSSQILITDKDKDGFSVSQWSEDERSDNFIYGEMDESSK